MRIYILYADIGPFGPVFTLNYDSVLFLQLKEAHCGLKQSLAEDTNFHEFFGVFLRFLDMDGNLLILCLGHHRLKGHVLCLDLSNYIL